MLISGKCFTPKDPSSFKGTIELLDEQFCTRLTVCCEVHDPYSIDWDLTLLFRVLRLRPLTESLHLL